MFHKIVPLLQKVNHWTL